MNRALITAVSVSLSAMAIPAVADAAVTINITNVGSDVVATVSGSLDLTGLTAEYSFSSVEFAIRGSPTFVGTGSVSQPVISFSGFTGPLSIGPGTNVVYADSSEGGIFAFNGGSYGFPLVFVVPSFVSGSSLTGSSTFLGASLASLGLTSGQYVYTSTADRITFNVGAAVPAPAAWILMTAGFGLVGGAMRTRRRSNARWA